VAELSARNQQTLIDAVVHAVNEDYVAMAGDFTRLGFLAPGTDIGPLVPALESIWSEALGSSLADFNFRTVTSRFNELVYQHPIRIPERYALVIRSLLTQEGICLRLRPAFHFLEVAYPYVARRLLTDDDPALRARLIQVLLQDGKFQWARLENLVTLARSGVGGKDKAAADAAGSSPQLPSGLDLSDTVASAARLVAYDPALRRQLLDAVTEGDRLHVAEVARLAGLLAADVDGGRVLREALAAAPGVGRQVAVAWADSVLSR
jgi:predicted unusual protein kinase regulating ubiquinone biosynthesis (AarF/ABC1/UbiB family)